MRGIVLAGGTGSRLWPITKGISKQLLPVYDKPLIHYPISTLFLAGIKEILIITTPKDQMQFKHLLGDGSQYGVSFEFATQDEPRGLAEAFIIGEDFIDGGNVALILGDNLFYGRGLGHQLRTQKEVQGATIFACHVENPTSYGVISFSPEGRPTSIEEKPSKPHSNYVVPGLYFYDQRVCAIAKQIERSERGELEITSINQHYLNIGSLNVLKLERDIAWLDVGSPDSFISASSFVQTIQQRHGQKISCLEEIAWQNGWISDAELLNLARSYQGNTYSKYLFNLLERDF